MIVNTLRLLGRIQAAYRTDDPEVHLCAESCLSYLIMYLKVDTLVLPALLYPHYEKLPQPWPTPNESGSSSPPLLGGNQQ